MFSLSNYEMKSVKNATDTIVSTLKSGIQDPNQDPEIPITLYFTYEISLVQESIDEKLFSFVSIFNKYEESLEKTIELNDDEIPNPQIVLNNPLNFDGDYGLILEDYRFNNNFTTFSIRLSEEELRSFLNFMLMRGIYPSDCIGRRMKTKPRNKSARK